MSTVITGYSLTPEVIVLLSGEKAVTVTRLNIGGKISYFIIKREGEQEAEIIGEIIGYEFMLDIVSGLLGSIVLDIKPEWRELN